MLHNIELAIKAGDSFKQLCEVNLQLACATFWQSAALSHFNFHGL